MFSPLEAHLVILHKFYIKFSGRLEVGFRPQIRYRIEITSPNLVKI